MAIAHIYASGINNASTTNIQSATWLIPNNGTDATAGDLAIITIGVNGGATTTFLTPTGWTELLPPGTPAGGLNTQTNHRTQAFGKELTSADLGATVTFTLSANAGKIHGGGFIVREHNGLANVVVAAVTDVTLAATKTGPTFNTTQANSMIYNVAMFRNTTATTQSTSTVSAGWTERSDTGTANAVIPNFVASIATRNTLQATTGSVTGATFTTTDTQSTGHVWAFAVGQGAAPTGNVVPSANAGTDKTGIEPYSIVPLVGVASDTDGTVTSAVWSQISGPTVVITGTGTSVTYKATGSIAGHSHGFRLTVTDNSGGVKTDDVLHTVLPVTERAAVGGVLVPMEIRIPTPVVAPTTNRGLGYIGDNITYQGGTENPRKSLVAAGWTDANVEVDGLADRTMVLAGVTHPNVQEVIDGWRTIGFDPYTWVIALGNHNENASDAAWTGWMTEVLDYIAAGPRSMYVVNWVGMAHPNAGDTRDSRFIAVVRALIGTRPKIILKAIDWNAYVHNGRVETNLWIPGDTQGRSMTAEGYALRNAYITAQVGTPT